MVTNNTPNITSFVIRFVHSTASDRLDANAYLGYIRHIQTDQEIVFTRWAEAESFLEKFVHLGGDSNSTRKGKD